MWGIISNLQEQDLVKNGLMYLRMTLIKAVLSGDNCPEVIVTNDFLADTTVDVIYGFLIWDPMK